MALCCENSALYPLLKKEGDKYSCDCVGRPEVSIFLLDRTKKYRYILLQTIITHAQEIIQYIHFFFKFQYGTR